MDAWDELLPCWELGEVNRFLCVAGAFTGGEASPIVLCVGGFWSDDTHVAIMVFPAGFGAPARRVYLTVHDAENMFCDAGLPLRDVTGTVSGEMFASDFIFACMWSAFISDQMCDVLGNAPVGSAVRERQANIQCVLDWVVKEGLAVGGEDCVVGWVGETLT